MKQIGKIFLCYFPVFLVLGQVFIDLLAILWPSAYISSMFYLGAFFGTNVLVSFFMVAFVFYFNFCVVSRASALAEFAFALNYLIVQEDNMYNLLFQIIVGTFALLVTVRSYVKKFPLCKISLLYTFMALLIRSGSCTSAMDSWQKEITHRIKQTL